MQSEATGQRLSAILFADVAGYTKLMEVDEAGTFAAWKRARDEVVAPTVAAHKGRIVKYTGDGFLAEFALAETAMACAVALQHGFTGRDPLKLRIGIHLGEVYIDGDDIYGDGVNVAARLESLSELGGICVSGAVRDLVHKKMPLEFIDGGKQALKHIAEPIQVYRVRVAGVTVAGANLTPISTTRRWKMPALAAGVVLVALAGGLVAWQPWVTRVEAASVARMAYPLPDRPSIAVMPFASLSDDKAQEYFADGVAEDIIVDLGQVSGLFVAARGSTFTYKGRGAKPRDIAEELGVRYVLDGSVRRAGDRVRVNVQLVDAIQGRQLWAERFERDTKDVFAVQNEVTKRVVAELAVTLKADEQERLYRKHTTSLPAYEAFLQARRLFYQPDVGAGSTVGKDDLLHGMSLFQKSIDLDPAFAGGYAGLSFYLSRYVRSGFSATPGMDDVRALELAKKAVALDKELAWSHMALGSAYQSAGVPERAIAAMREAVHTQPSEAEAWASLSYVLGWNSQGAEAIDAIKTAFRLNPNFPGLRYRAYLGRGLFSAGRYRELLDASLTSRSAPVSPEVVSAQLRTAAAHVALGEIDEARGWVKLVLDKYPETSIATLQPSARLFHKKEDLERLYDLYRKAGLPD